MIRGNGGVPAVPALLGASQAYSDTEGTNLSATAATINMVGITGNDFTAGTSGSDFALTAAGCVWTYTGANGRRFLVDLRASVYALGSSQNYVGAAIDKSGDAIAASKPLAAGFQESSLEIGESEALLACQRMLTLDSGDTLAPCFSCLSVLGGVSGRDVTITALTFTISPQS